MMESTIRQGLFYFISEDIVRACPYAGLMDMSKGPMQDRPCLCVAVNVSRTLFWMVPVSSRVDKYMGIYRHKMETRGVCDTIVFGDMQGNERAFLIQNIFPVTAGYVTSVYRDRHGLPVCVEPDVLRDVISKSNKIISLERHGIRVTFTDIEGMLAKLMPEIEARCGEEPVLA